MKALVYTHPHEMTYREEPQPDPASIYDYVFLEKKTEKAREKGES